MILEHDPLEQQDENVVIVRLRRRTLPEQVEWLIEQVAWQAGHITGLERDVEALILAVKSLENRTRAVERATPLVKPKPASTSTTSTPLDNLRRQRPL
jgi:hypothetical protein